MERVLNDFESEPELSDADQSVVALGDEHERGVESLCVGEAA
ncbi:MAG: hypothetical protein ACLP9C_11920 [Acidimicrobiales bacterium]